MREQDRRFILVSTLTTQRLSRSLIILSAS
jgi:hypothetical protein